MKHTFSYDFLIAFDNSRGDYHLKLWPVHILEQASGRFRPPLSPWTGLYSCCRKSMLHWVPMFPLPQRGSIVTIGKMPSLVLMILIVRVNTHTHCLKDPLEQIKFQSIFSLGHNTIWHQTLPFPIKMAVILFKLDQQTSKFFKPFANCKK